MMIGSIIESMMMTQSKKKKTHLNIYVLPVHLYFSATDGTWYIALRLVFTQRQLAFYNPLVPFHT